MVLRKADLVKLVSEKTGETQKQAGKTVTATFEVIQEALAIGEVVTYPGFGKFTVNDRAARKGRNPQTGEEIEIAEGKRVAFKPGKALKDAVRVAPTTEAE